MATHSRIRLLHALGSQCTYDIMQTAYADMTQASAVEQTSMILPVVAKEFGVSSSQVQWIAATNTIVWVSGI